jgi:hypothetical protein
VIRVAGYFYGFAIADLHQYATLAHAGITNGMDCSGVQHY